MCHLRLTRSSGSWSPLNKYCGGNGPNVLLLIVLLFKYEFSIEETQLSFWPHSLPKSFVSDMSLSLSILFSSLLGVVSIGALNGA